MTGTRRSCVIACRAAARSSSVELTKLSVGKPSLLSTSSTRSAATASYRSFATSEELRQLIGDDLARVLVALERPQLAARVLASAEAYRAAIGAPSLSWRQVGHNRTVADLRRLLGPETYAAAWSEGSALAIDQAAAEALAT